LAYRFLAYRFLAYRFAGSRLALAAMADTLSENNTPWTSHFFDEEHIVDTFQNLLAYTPQTVEDLYRLCVAAREDRIVLRAGLHCTRPRALRKSPGICVLLLWHELFAAASHPPREPALAGHIGVLGPEGDTVTAEQCSTKH
jgi:hypothetical protein